MNDLIEEYALLNDIIFGICNADDLTGESEDIVNIPFFKGNFCGRVSPEAFLNGAKSVIVLGSKTDRTPVFEGLDQVMAASMSGVDYHNRLGAIAQGLVSKMLERVPFNFKIQLDTGPLIERSFALKAGLGFVGLNRCIINHEIGSFFNIALIVVDIGLDSTQQNDVPVCEGCGKCISACPGKALSTTKFDYTRCISYLTQKKGVLTEEEMNLIGASIYGCDICQNVCPHNSIDEALRQNGDAAEVIKNILKMSRSQFNENFRASNFFWRGKSIIKRNCLIVLRNLETD